MLKKITKLKRYFLKTFFIYLITALITYALNINAAEQTINTLGHINELSAFQKILITNTIGFLWIILGLFIGKMTIYSFLLTNGITLGLLISKFKTVRYFLLILPHGIIEISTFLFTCSIVLLLLDKKYINKKYYIYLLIPYAFILLSAFVEAFITPNLIKFI